MNKKTETPGSSQFGRCARVQIDMEQVLEKRKLKVTRGLGGGRGQGGHARWASEDHKLLPEAGGGASEEVGRGWSHPERGQARSSQAVTAKLDPVVGGSEGQSLE